VVDMESPDLNSLKLAFQNALQRWIATIQKWQELLASTSHSARAEDVWKQADFEQEDARKAVQDAKDAYEDAVRKANFGF